jgi:hypothetical protein
MPRSRGRTHTIFGKTVIMKKNPWYSPRLKAILERLGKEPKKPEYILAQPPPWFGDPTKLSREQYERCKLFSIVASQTAGMRAEERIPIISAKLKTGRKPRPRKLKEKKFHEIYPTYESLVGRVVAPAPAVAPVIRE